MKEYKVLRQERKGLSGIIDTQEFEDKLNYYAYQGWEFKDCVALNSPNSNLQSLFLILEKNI